MSQEKNPPKNSGLIWRLFSAEKEGAHLTWQAMAYNAFHALRPIYNLAGKAWACGEYFVKNDQTDYVDASNLHKTRDEGRIA